MMVPGAGELMFNWCQVSVMQDKFQKSAEQHVPIVNNTDGFVKRVDLMVSVLTMTTITKLFVKRFQEEGNTFLPQVYFIKLKFNVLLYFTLESTEIQRDH